MNKTIKTSFTLKSESPSGGRIGTIHFGRKGIIKTPAFFPAMCIMTGPPGFGRNGAIYKYIKRIMCLDWKFNYFLSEILHFTDFFGTRESLNKWLQHPFQHWMDEMMKGGNIKSGEEWGDQGHRDDFDYSRKEKPYETCFFLDSGGFKLLGNSDFSIEKYGFKTTAENILHLQTMMGGDIIASLDYPLPPVEYDTQTLRSLQEKSLKNNIQLLRLLSKRKKDEPQPLAYLAIHGVDYETTKECTERLLRKLDRENLKYPSFGFAIGSLVPRRGNRSLIANIVKGLKDAIQEHNKGYYMDKPIHAFGMSSDIVPILAYLGVDTFDSNSFVQAGKNLKYILPYSRDISIARKSKNFAELNENDLLRCNCRACKACVKQLKNFKLYLNKKSFARHELEGVNKRFIKSGIYAFISLHALEIELREFDTIRHEIAQNRLGKYVLDCAEKTNNSNMLYRAYEAATGKIIERPQCRKVSLGLRRESFAIPESYQIPQGKEILLLLPCTKDKPYKKARSHEAVMLALHKDYRIHVVTVSGLYGPVPEELEEEPEIMHYDYLLTQQAKEQSEFIKSRLVAYLKRYGNSYRQIIAYVTVRAYRDVVNHALKDYSKGILLPGKPKERTSKEFLKSENISELQSIIGMYLENNTSHYKKYTQLKLMFK